MKGYKELVFTNDVELAHFYENQQEYADEIGENQFLLIRLKQDPEEEGEIIDKYVKEDGTLRALYFRKIPSSPGIEETKPRNIYQEMAIESLHGPSKVKVLSGVFGSGKSFLGLNYALYAISRGKYDKLIWVRNNVELAGVPELGALPGTLEEKLSGFSAVLADKVGGFEKLADLQEKKKISIEHLGFLRGRDFKNSIVYMTEAQNIDSGIAKLLVGRIGEGSILMLDGDYKQTDTKLFERDNGFNLIIDALSGDELFSHVFLPNSERSDVARLADKIEKYEEGLLNK